MRDLRSDRMKDRLPPVVFMEALDGHPLGARVYEPLGRAARATLVVHAATATLETYYSRFAAHAAAAGFRVITYDYRGMGLSRRSASAELEATMTGWARLDASAALATARSFGDPVILVGHSFGGQTLALADAMREVDGAILVGAQEGYWGLWPAHLRPRHAAIWYAIVPSATRLFGYLPGRLGLGEDLPLGVATEWTRWCKDPGYYRVDHPEASERLRAFDKPVLLYSFADDDFAPPGAVDAFVSSFAPDTVIHRRIDPRAEGRRPIGHFGFFRPRQGGHLWAEALGFADDIVAGRAPVVAEVASREPSGIRLEEIMADLSFGRDR